MTYIWETSTWSDLAYDAAALQTAFGEVSASAGEFAGLRAGLSEC